MTVWNLLMDPPARYRTKPFWSWNDDLNKHELLRQIEEMHEAGIGGFFIHARGGLTVPYMGEQWMELIEFCIEKSQELGMEVWLYDENGWPSGYADGKLPALGHSYQQKRLSYEWAPFKQEEKMTIATYIQIEDRLHLLDQDDPRRPDFQVYYEVNPYYIDTLSKHVVSTFIAMVYDAYWLRLGTKYGSAIKGIFTDEPQFGRGELPWSLELANVFESRCGYSLFEALPELFLETDNCRKTRHDYWSCVTTMFTEAYAKQVGAWCGERGWMSVGHVVDEQTLMSQVTSVGDPLCFYEYLHIPGCDWLGRSVGEDPLVPKQVSSVVRQLGKKQAMTESYGCSGWNISFQDLKRIGEWQFVHGMNLLCQHLQAYTLRGLRKRDYPPSLFYQQPWWEHYHHFNDYFARLSMLLVEGTRQAEVLLLHPISTAWVEQTGTDSSRIEPYHQSFAQLSRWLCQSFIEHDYGSEGMLERHGHVDGGRFVVGEASYSVVVISPSVTLSSRTVQLLHQFILQGGMLIALEPYPRLIHGEQNEDINRLIHAALKPANTRLSIAKLISGKVPPSISVNDRWGNPIASDMVNVQTLKLGDSFLYYLVNSGDETYSNAEITIHQKGTLSRIDLQSGDFKSVNQKTVDGGTQVVLTLYPAPSYMLRLAQSDVQCYSDPIKRLQTHLTDSHIHHLDNQWKIEEMDVNSITLDTCRYRVKNGEWSTEMPLIFIQEKLLQIGSPVHMELEFSVNLAFEPAEEQKLYLVVENPEKMQIVVNGNQVESTSCGWWRDISFQKIDIGGCLTSGLNKIRLHQYFWNTPETYAAMARASQFESEANKLTLDTEIESIYIIGDFAVDSQSGYVDDKRGVKYTDGPFVLADALQVCSLEEGLISQGLPFFAGSIRVAQTVQIQLDDGVSWYWDFASPPDATVTRLRINGADTDVFLWEPFVSNITEYLRPGENLIELELTGSCRNLLGPHHHIKGEPIKVGPDSFRDKPGWTDKDLQPNTSIYQNRYAFVPFGLSAAPRMICIPE